MVLNLGFSAIMGIMIPNHYSSNSYRGKKDSTPLQAYPEPFRMFILPAMLQIMLTSFQTCSSQQQHSHFCELLRYDTMIIDHTLGDMICDHYDFFDPYHLF
jgi:hypothetical protein